MNIKVNVSLTWIVAMVALIPVMVSGFEFDFIRSTSTTACVQFRASDSDPWAYLDRDGITNRTAERFCRTYYPTAITGVLLTSPYSCRQYGTSIPSYNITVDCADSSAPLDNCTIGGNTTAYRPTNYYHYGVGIECILDPRWSYTSTFSTDVNYLTASGGVYGTQINRTISMSPFMLISEIRPDDKMESGTICLPPNTTEEPGSNLAKALCRTAGFPASTTSTLTESTSSSKGYQPYFSNIQCSVSSSGTLWNRDCSSTTHYYDTPTTNCSSQLPRLSCPITFDMKLGDPIVSTGSDNGFQLVQLRPSGSRAYDGIMCLSGYASNFASAMCREMYGDDIDFAAAFTYYSSSSLPAGTKEYLSSVRCSSYTDTNLSKCTATVTPPNLQYPCSTYRGMVSCKLNDHNIVFSISGNDNDPAKGYLMAAVSVKNQGQASVCSDGFDQNAVVAACRTLGYTPGPNATFTVSPAASSYTINSVVCPSAAKNLTECKMQYSGTGYAISYAAKQICSGRVSLDCDLGAPQVEFRTSSGYLQARLYPTSEWGWVYTGSGVTSKEGYFAMCQYSTSTSGDSTITKSFLSVSYCPSWASSYTDCTFSYTNVKRSRDFYCSYYSPSSKVAAPSSSSSSSSGLGTGAIVGIAIGVPVFIIAAIVFVIIQMGACNRDNEENDEQQQTATGAANNANGRTDEVEMTTNEPPDDSIYGQPVMGTAFPGLSSGGGGEDGDVGGFTVGVTADNLPGRPYGIGAYQ